MSNVGLNLYLLFVASWFLRLPARLPVLGTLRVDLLLVVAMAGFALVTRKERVRQPLAHPTEKILRVLIAYALLTVPFVEWPGTVIKIGLPEFIKAVVFYYFTVAFVTTERDLRRLMVVFVACQIFRVLEPLYLHVTYGYWGNAASMEGGAEFLERLSGGPFDIVNANGLAFVICTILPFMYFLSRSSWRLRILFLLITPALLYALALTGSRSGLIGIGIVGVGILIKSKHRTALLVVIVLIATVGFNLLSPDMQDRYLSIFGKGEKNAATAAERYEGMSEQLRVALRRPLFGHGLGTSAEANSHFSTAGPYVGRAIPAHNLYLEVAQELGFTGVIIFALFVMSIATAFLQSQRVLGRLDAGQFLPRLNDAMQVWLAMSIVFSFASYGLSSYDWYFFAGLSAVTQRMAASYDHSSERPGGRPYRKTKRRGQ